MDRLIKRMYASLASKPRGGPLRLDMGEILAMLRWQVEGSRLTLAIDAAHLDKLITEAIAPSLRRARHLALRSISAANLNAIGKAMIIYAAGDNDTFPPNLQVLVEKQFLSPRALVNPARPGHKPGYVYLPPRQPIRSAAETLVAYEAHDQWGEGVNILCADRHVEFLRDRTRFEKLLKQAKAEPPATTGPGPAPK